MTVIWVALVGIVINGATALGFVSGRKDDINIRGAFLHMVRDAVVSLGVVLSALAVLWTGWQWIDPAVSIVVALVIVFGTWSLLKESSTCRSTPCRPTSTAPRSSATSPACPASPRCTTCTSGR
jgi:Co/Zn/Cd efflux system component